MRNGFLQLAFARSRDTECDPRLSDSQAFTMTAYMHGDLDADRELADTMARLILPGALGPDGDDDDDDDDDQPTS